MSKETIENYLQKKGIKYVKDFVIPESEPTKTFIVKGSFTYKVQKEVKATDKAEARMIATDSEPLLEWDSQDQDCYLEEIDAVEEKSDE